MVKAAEVVRAGRNGYEHSKRGKIGLPGSYGSNRVDHLDRRSSALKSDGFDLRYSVGVYMNNNAAEGLYHYNRRAMPRHHNQP